MTTTIPATSDIKPVRRRRWVRWTLISLAALLVLLVVSVMLYVKLAPVPAPLALPAQAASAPTGPVEGNWVAGEGSEAGYRIQQTALFVSGDLVQRTSALTGTLTASDEQISTAAMRIDLATITDDNGAVAPQLALSLDTANHPNTTLTLTRPIALPEGFTTGATVTATATGELSLRGVSRPVTFTVTARRDGDTVQATGSIPVAFADWGIPSPEGYGALGSLADHGVAEFLLVLRHG
jgi:polyisoprenoid-binding protein YceI